MARKGENIIKRKDGRWEARLIVSRDENGKAKYKYLYGKTYTEAKSKKEYEQSRIILCVTKIPPNSLTVNDLANEFLVHKKVAVKTSTMAHYENLIQTYITQAIGNMRLLHITPIIIEKLTQAMLSSGKKNGDGLSPKTIRDILALLRSMFRFAVMRKYMAEDILNFSMPKTVPNDISVMKENEQSRLEQLALSTGDSFKFGAYLCLYTGLRIGEICSLRWSDIDFEQSTLSVNRTIQRIKAQGKAKTEIIITEPKTRTSIRTIPISSSLMKQLTAQKLKAKSDSSYILTGTEKYIEPSNYYMKYKRWLRKLYLPDYSFHTLRHTFATRCIEHGFDAKSLSEILGHSDVRITLNRYVHPSMELKRTHMERLMPVNLQSETVSLRAVT